MSTGTEAPSAGREYVENLLKLQREATLKGIQSLSELQKEVERVLGDIKEKSGTEIENGFNGAREWLDKVNELRDQAVSNSFDLVEQSVSKWKPGAISSEFPFKKEFDDMNGHIQESMRKLSEAIRPK